MSLPKKNKWRRPGCFPPKPKPGEPDIFVTRNSTWQFIDGNWKRIKTATTEDKDYKARSHPALWWVPKFVCWLD